MGAAPFRLLEETAAHPHRKWTPAIVALLTGIIATWFLLPTLSAPTLSGFGLWILATRCTVPVFIASALAFLLTARGRIDEAIGVACLATWFPPLAIFYTSRSPIAALIAIAIAATLTRAMLIRTTPAEPNSGLFPALCTGFLLEAAALAIAIDDWRTCVFVLAAASSLVVWLLTTRNLWPPRAARLRRVRIVPALLLGVTFSAGGLSPYLAHGKDNGGGGSGGGLLTVLLRSPEKSTSPSKANGTSPAVIVGESYPGVILWPDTEKHVILVPPLPRTSRSLFASRAIDELSIPFYGAYYFFKAPGPMPKNSFVAHGDPVSMTFRSTDLGPLAMEARQNFARLIDVNCCASIAVIIRNGDFRPGSLALELTLRNTTLPQKPLVTLGPEPIPPAIKNHPPADQSIVFPMRPTLSLRQFDEVTVRILRPFPTADRSARISIRRFIFSRRG